MGVTLAGKDVLEIGCGSGFAAQLILLDAPRSCVGVDVMPEQLAVARRRGLTAAEFRLEDATRLASVPTASIDLVVVFGILHHFPEWPRAVAEYRRVLRPGGEVYLEEPDGGALGWFDTLFQWGHPRGARFQLKALFAELEAHGFEPLGRRWAFGFGFYRGRVATVPSS
jgi:SAM-dependent methyltransferase